MGLLMRPHSSGKTVQIFPCMMFRHDSLVSFMAFIGVVQTVIYTQSCVQTLTIINAAIGDYYGNIYLAILFEENIVHNL